MSVTVRGVSRLGITLALILSSASLIGCSGASDDSSGSNTPADEPPPASNPPPPSSPPPTSGTDTLLHLGWQPNSEAIAGYLVYYGATPDTATVLASDLPVTESDFDPKAPSARYYAARDLKLNAGDTVCFRIRAYFSNDVMSDWSQAACGTV